IPGARFSPSIVLRTNTLPVSWMTAAHAGTRRALWYGTRSYTMSVAGRIPDSMIEPRIGRSVSLDHAAELLGVSRRTIYNRIRDGRLQTIRTAGGSQRVVLDSVSSAFARTSHSPLRGRFS